MLTTHGGRDAKAASSLFVNEVLAGSDTDVELIDRATSWEIPAPEPMATQTPPWPWPAGWWPCPRSASAGWRCACGRPSWWASWRARTAPIPRRRTPGRPSRRSWPGWGSARPSKRMKRGPRDSIRITLQEIAVDGGAGANLLDVVAAAVRVQLLGLRHLRALSAAVRVQVRLPHPGASEPAGAAHLRQHRPRGVRGLHQGASRARWPAARHRPPGRTWSGSSASAWVPMAFGDRPTEEAYHRRIDTLLGNFWTGEVARPGRGHRGGAGSSSWCSRIRMAARRWWSAAPSTASTGCRRAASR